MDDETRAAFADMTERIDEMHGEMTAGFAEVNVTLRRIEGALTTTMQAVLQHLSDHRRGTA